MHCRAGSDSALDRIDAIRDLHADDLDFAEDMGDREMRRPCNNRHVLAVRGGERTRQGRRRTCMRHSPDSDSLFDRPDASPPVQPAKAAPDDENAIRCRLPIRKRVVSMRDDASRCPRCSRPANAEGSEAHSRGFRGLGDTACGDGRPARPAAWLRTVIRFQNSNPCARMCRSAVVRAGTSATEPARRRRRAGSGSPRRARPDESSHREKGMQYAANANSEAGAEGGEFPNADRIPSRALPSDAIHERRQWER